eukprot:3060580-Lingulodinium_polyedra.AAC.1
MRACAYERADPSECACPVKTAKLVFPTLSTAAASSVVWSYLLRQELQPRSRKESLRGSRRYEPPRAGR